MKPRKQQRMTEKAAVVRSASMELLPMYLKKGMEIVKNIMKATAQGTPQLSGILISPPGVPLLLMSIPVIPF
jgi:hypothetical protein